MNAYEVGLLTGSMIPLAGLGYFLGRKLSGPSGVSEVERLSHAAGIAQPGSKPPSRLRGVVPYVLALGGALVGLAFGMISLHKERAGNIDPVKLEESFVSGCSKSCLTKGDANVCAAFCACELAALKSSHTTAKGLSDFFQAVQDKKPEATQEFRSAQEKCVWVVRSAAQATQ